MKIYMNNKQKIESLSDEITKKLEFLLEIPTHRYINSKFNTLLKIQSKNNLFLSMEEKFNEYSIINENSSVIFNKNKYSNSISNFELIKNDYKYYYNPQTFNSIYKLYTQNEVKIEKDLNELLSNLDKTIIFYLSMEYVNVTYLTKKKEKLLKKEARHKRLENVLKSMDYSTKLGFLLTFNSDRNDGFTKEQIAAEICLNHPTSINYEEDVNNLIDKIWMPVLLDESSKKSDVDRGYLEENFEEMKYLTLLETKEVFSKSNLYKKLQLETQDNTVNIVKRKKI